MWTHMTSPQPCQVQAGIGPLAEVGRVPQLATSWHPAASLPRLSAHQPSSSWAVLQWNAGCRPFGAVSYQACPAISCNKDRFTEIRDEPQPQQQQQRIPFLPSRGQGQLQGSQEVGGFPSLTQRENLSLGSKDSVLGSSTKFPAQNPRAGFPKPEFGPTPGEKSRASMSVKNYNKIGLAVLAV